MIRSNSFIILSQIWWRSQTISATTTLIVVLPALLKSSNRPNILYATSKDFMYALNAITILRYHKVNKAYFNQIVFNCID